MTESVHLTFRYLESDYVRAMRLHYANRLRLPLDVLVLVLLIGGGVYLRRSSPWLSVGCFAVVATLALMLVAAFFVIPRVVFRREPKFRDEHSLEFSSAGIHFRTANIDSQLQWSLYSHALIDASSYLLYYGQSQFTVIPKRIFHDTEQRMQFEKLLVAHVSPITKRGE